MTASTRLHPGRWLKLVASCLVIALAAAPSRGKAPQVISVVQKDRDFDRATLTVAPGTVVEFENQDDFPHQIHVVGPGLDVDSDLQGPGERIRVRIPRDGLFEVTCGIHPRMRLEITAKQ